MTLLEAAKSALDYIANREVELGITLFPGVDLRGAIKEEEENPVADTILVLETARDYRLAQRDWARAERDELRDKLKAMERVESEYVPMTHEELWAAWIPGSYNYDALRAFEQAVVRRMRGET